MEATKKYRLEDDPMCGVTTGGSEECFWDCELELTEIGIIIASNPECLFDCFPKVKFTNFTNLFIKCSMLILYKNLGYLFVQTFGRLLS